MAKAIPRTDGRLEETKRIARVLQIVQLLSAQPRVWTRRRLAKKFEIGERMIDKDLELVRHGAVCRHAQLAEVERRASR